MRTRILNQDEYDRLEESGEPQIYPHVNPEDMFVVAIEDESNNIVAQMTVAKVTHFESVWIAPEHRGNPAIVRALLGQAFALADASGARWVMGGADEGNPQMASYLERLKGTPIRAQFYALPVRGRA